MLILYIRNLQRLVNIIDGTSLYTLVSLALDKSTDNLDYLNYKNHKQHAGPGNIAVASLMAVDYCYLAKTGAADGGGHCAVAKDSDHRDHGAVDKCGLCLGKEYAGDDLEVGTAHGLGGFDNAGADLLDGGLNHSAHIGSGCNNQHHYDGTVANTLKGNFSKGPFHLPRMLYLVDKLERGENIW